MRYLYGFFWYVTAAGFFISLISQISGTAFPLRINLNTAHSALVQTLWVDDGGDNSNPCSQTQPCRTIGYVLEALVEEGDVINVQAGIYREQLDISQKGITLQGIEAGVYIYGSEKPVLTEEEGKYVADWSWGASFKGTTFCNNLTNDVILDDDHCNTLGFWQNGVRLLQVFSKTSVVAGTFYYDFDNERVWLLPVAGNDNLDEIEGLAYPYAVKLTSESRDVTLDNLNIWYGASLPDDGILQVEGSGHNIADVDVRYSAGAGILVYGADQVFMDNVQASYHGQNGWRVRADASFSSSSGWEINDWVDDLQLGHSTSRDNGWKGYDNCWGGGGTKFSFTHGLNIDAFYSADNNGFGIWLDIENHTYVIEESLSARDAGRGIFVEYISDNGVVENNVIYGTKDADAIGCGISIGLAAADSRDVLIKNNTVYSTADDVKGFMLKTGCSTCRSFPYPSESIAWENNLLIHKDAAGFVRDLDAGTADTFTFLNTTIEEEFAGDGSVFVCWDGLGNCSIDALDIKTISPGTYLADTDSECGFNVINNLIDGRGVQTFVHPRAEEICDDAPAPVPPAADFGFSVDGSTVSFTDLSIDDGQIVDWNWSFGDGTESGDQNPLHTYEMAGTYTISLTVTDNDGLSDTSFDEVSIESGSQPQPPVAEFVFEIDALTVQFTDTSTDDGSITAWNWDFGDGVEATNQHPEHVYTEAGTYTVSLTVTDDESLTTNIKKTLSVEAEPAEKPPSASFIYIVDEYEVDFTDQSTDEDGVIASWAWDFGDGETSQIQHPVHLYTQAGIYTVNLEVIDNSGLSNSTGVQVEVADADAGEGAFIEVMGRVVMEAEHYVEQFSNLETMDLWQLQEAEFNNEPVLSMQALPDDGDIVLSDYRVGNAEMRFPMALESSGTFYVWLRVWALQNGSTVYVGCEGQSIRMGVSSQVVPGEEWAWYGMKNEGRRAQFHIALSGEKTFTIWMREDGLFIDRILLTTDKDFVPEGIGPAESPRAIVSANPWTDGMSRDKFINPPSISLPKEITVHKAYPNPAIHTVHVEIDLPNDMAVQGALYDMLGRSVGTIDRQFLLAGIRRKVWVDTSTLPAGVYLYTLIVYEPEGIKKFAGQLVIAGR